MIAPEAPKATAPAGARDLRVDVQAGELEHREANPDTNTAQGQTALAAAFARALARNEAQHAVDRALGNVLDGIHAARRAGWCPICEQPIVSPYLREFDEPQPKLSARERERRRLLDLRVSAILLGRVPPR